MVTLFEIIWEFIKAVGGLLLVTLTAPFWGPWYLLERLFGYCDERSRKIKIVLQIIFTALTSLLYIVVIVSMFTDPTYNSRDDRYYDRQNYYERKYEPEW